MTGVERTLGHRSIFILPTREGGMFAAIVFVLLLASINYGNGLGYAVTFLLAAMGSASAITAQRNLLGLSYSEEEPRSDFAGQPVGFRVQLVARRRLGHVGVTIQIVGGASVTIDIAAGERRVIELPRPTERRGWVSPPRIRVSSRYPLGLLRAFSRRQRLTYAAIAYPRPAARASLPPGALARTAADSDAPGAGGGGDFEGLAAFREGESPRHIHWKAAAAGRGLLVKRFAGQSDKEIWLTVQGPEGLEARLARTCRQVIDAERGGYFYGLVLEDRRLPPRRGGPHFENCLSALGIYGEQG